MGNFFNQYKQYKYNKMNIKDQIMNLTPLDLESYKKERFVMFAAFGNKLELGFKGDKYCISNGKMERFFDNATDATIAFKELYLDSTPTR